MVGILVCFLKQKFATYSGMIFFNLNYHIQPHINIYSRMNYYYFLFYFKINNNYVFNLWFILVE